MKKEELIKKISKLPDGIEVCVVDLAVNLNSDAGEGSSDGIYTDFSIEVCPADDLREGSKPFAMISVEDQEYFDSFETVDSLDDLE